MVRPNGVHDAPRIPKIIFYFFGIILQPLGCGGGISWEKGVMEYYKIEKGVPLQEGDRSECDLFPLGGMEVGDSFVVPLDGRRGVIVRNFVLITAGRYSVRNRLGWVFTSSILEDGVRIWRIK